jgi:hypothetical protein
MCYNCGCGLPNENHGNPNWITNETFDKSKEEGQSLEDVKKNALELLKKELGEDKEPRPHFKTAE